METFEELIKTLPNYEWLFIIPDNIKLEKDKILLHLKNAISIYLTYSWNLTNNNAREQVSNILSKINNLDISLWDIYWIEKKESFIYIYLWDKSKFFVLNLDDPSDTWEIYSRPSLGDNKKRILELEQEIEKITSAMDEIYKNNYYELDNNSWFEFSEDVIMTDKYWKTLWWESIKWKNIRQLKELLDVFQRELLLRYNITWETTRNLKSFEQRLAFIFGIWDEYESWASYFNMSSVESRDVAKKEIKKLLSQKTPEESLDYLIRIHEIIDKNQKQSDIVEKSYTFFTQELHKQIFEKLKENNAKDELFLRFAKITTWRGIVVEEGVYYRWVLYKVKWKKTLREMTIDDNYRSPEYANKAILYIVYRKWWLMSRVSVKEAFKIQDEKLNWRTPVEIVTQVKEKLEKYDWWIIQLRILWLWEILNTRETDYQNLSFDEKIYISILLRLIDKLTIPKRTFHQRQLYWNKIQIWEEYKELNNLNINDLLIIFQEISIEWYEDLFSWLHDNLGSGLWKKASDLWIEDWSIEQEIFNLFKDINWMWFFDISDESWETMKSSWRFVGMIWLMALVWYVVWPFIWAGALLTVSGQVKLWAAMWFSGSAITIAMDSKGYETFGDMALDTWSDFALWTVLWAIWGWLTHKIWSRLQILWQQEFLSKKWFQNHGLTVFDAVILWMLLESHRIEYIEEKIKQDRKK